MTYDLDKERVETDDQDNVIRIFYEGERIFHEYWHCFDCSWIGEIDQYSRFLDNCPECGAEKGPTSLKIEEQWDGALKDARDQAVREKQQN